ncbi:MAG: hypothetical protein OXH52_13590 [Gammaproteobacteria bacterium]|nr:hypothetical protein [Gammaproteobacteria bacterium]
MSRVQAKRNVCIRYQADSDQLHISAAYDLFFPDAGLPGLLHEEALLLRLELLNPGEVVEA